MEGILEDRVTEIEAEAGMMIRLEKNP